MNILHISTFDTIGGAAIAASRMNVAFNRMEEISSSMLVLEKRSLDPTIFEVLPKVQKYLYKCIVAIDFLFVKKILKTSYTYSAALNGINVKKHPLVRKADVIYIHWYGNSYLNIGGVRRILELGKPTFIFLHDMYNITGGCHNSFDCIGYSKDCSHCPIIQRKVFCWYSSKVLKRKRSLLKYSNLHLIAPSKWLGNCIEQSSLFHGSSHMYVIPNVIDTSLFKVVDRNFARRVLNLPQDKKLVLFGAFGELSLPFKGWQYLRKALQKINMDGVELLTFGGYLSDEDVSEIRYPIHQFGMLNDQYSLMLLYNASDVYVTPSLAESFGMTVAESIACGTPVVGFDIGGIPDIIKQGNTGYLAKYKDSDDLAKCVISAIIGKDSLLSRDDMHSYAEVNFSPEVIARKHMNIWR